MNDVSVVVNKVINEPLYKNPTHTEYSIKILVSLLVNICQNISGTEEEIVDKIVKYMKSSVTDRNEYYDYIYGEDDCFDRSELIYRTAYATLVKKQAISVGFCETIKILFDIFDIENNTLVYTMDNKIFNYAILAKVQNNYIVVDPWLELICEKHMWSYKDIVKNNLYFIDNSANFLYNYEENGFGVNAEEYLKKLNVKVVKGINSVHELLK